VSQEPTIINPNIASAKKCSRCGLMNFTERTQCARCGQELSPLIGELKSTPTVLDDPGDGSRLKVGVIVVFVAVLLGGLFWLYILKDQGTPDPVAETAVVQPAPEPVQQAAEIPAQNTPESRDAAKQVLTGLKRFERDTNLSMTFEEYEAMLNRLRADLNSKLPEFVDHNPSDEAFRKEVEGALRDYTAAQNWWKTVMRNSAVLTDADRTERLIPNWESAKAHIENAEKALAQ